QDLAFRWVIVLFGAFILACGTTHVMDIVTLWYPVYWYQVAVVAITAMLSVGTAIAAWRIMPIVLRLPSQQQLLALNAQLAEQVRLRERAEQDLRTLNEDLAARASELEAIFAAQADGVGVFDPQRRLVRANAAWRAIHRQYADAAGLGADPAFAA